MLPLRTISVVLPLRYFLPANVGLTVALVLTLYGWWLPVAINGPWLAASIAAGVVFFGLRHSLNRIEEAVGFIHNRGLLHGKQLPQRCGAKEIQALTHALNHTAQFLHDQDALLNQAYTELQEQQYALDQHANRCQRLCD